MADVSIRNVTKQFGKSEVIHGISCDIRDGEFIVILGPSGCGKSTLLRMIAGLEEISSGEVADRRAGGEPPGAGRARHRHGLSELRALSRT